MMEAHSCGFHTKIGFFGYLILYASGKQIVSRLCHTTVHVAQKTWWTRVGSHRIQRDAKIIRYCPWLSTDLDRASSSKHGLTSKITTEHLDLGFEQVTCLRVIIYEILLLIAWVMCVQWVDI
jgi:hypothetical protein